MRKNVSMYKKLTAEDQLLIEQERQRRSDVIKKEEEKDCRNDGKGAIGYGNVDRLEGEMHGFIAEKIVTPSLFGTNMIIRQRNSEGVLDCTYRGKMTQVSSPMPPNGNFFLGYERTARPIIEGGHGDDCFLGIIRFVINSTENPYIEGAWWEGVMSLISVSYALSREDWRADRFKVKALKPVPEDRIILWQEMVKAAH